MVLGLQDSEFFPNFVRTLFTYAFFALKIGTKNGLINTTKNGKIVKWP